MSHFSHPCLFLNFPHASRLNSFFVITCIFSSVSKNMIPLLRQTACLLSCYLLLISLSPLSYCCIFSISVLTEFHFRVSFCFMPLSHHRECLFFTYPTRPSHPQIYCHWRLNLTASSLCCNFVDVVTFWGVEMSSTINKTHFCFCRHTGNDSGKQVTVKLITSSNYYAVFLSIHKQLLCIQGLQIV